MSVDMPRLVARVAQGAEKTDAWSAATAVLRQLPPETVFELAKKLLVDSYFRVSEAADGDRSVTMMPLKPSRPKRQRSAGSVQPRTQGQRDFDRSVADADKAFWGSISRSLEKFKNELRDEWTAELLSERFDGADGVVTWGDATVRDHSVAWERGRMTASAAVLCVAMHEKAIDDLKALGVDTLAELASAAAA